MSGDYYNFHLYELSNLGRIKSLIIEKILKPQLDGGGYLHIGLYKDNKVKTHKISHLVWDHFGNRKRKGSKIQVDHIKNNKLLNGIRDLQLLTARENVSKWYIQNGKKSSRFTGVPWNKTSKIWKVKITINKKENYLGRFNDEIEASDEYQRALKEFKETGKVTINTPAMKRKTSRYKGVHWNNKEKKWIAQIFINGKHIHFGAFINEDEAHLAYKNKLKNWR